MDCRRMVAGCTACVLALSAVAQDAAALNRLFEQAFGYESGTGVARDPGAAVALYETAARAGHAPSMVRLGYLRHAGTGTRQDLPGAFALYDAAANARNLQGQFMRAMCHAQGVGVRKDPATARQLLLEPADSGHQLAQYSLAIMILSGEGGPKREAPARRWFDRAASGPDRDLAARAADFRDRIDQHLFEQGRSGERLLLGVAAWVLLMGATGTTLDSSGPSTSGNWPTGGSSNGPAPRAPPPSLANGDITRSLHGSQAIGLGPPVRLR